MSFAATVLNVMLASPGDVTEERGVARDVINQWNAVHAEHLRVVLLPVGWDTHASPIMGDRGQQIINRQVLFTCDLLVAIFWTRLGSPTGDSISGTVEEITRHVDAGKPAMLYFSDTPVHPSGVDDVQYRALRHFRDECFKRGLVETFDSLEQFREKFTRQLAQTIIRSFPVGAADAEEHRSAAPGLSQPARELLLEAVRDQAGTLLCIDSDQGLGVATNQKQFVTDGDARSEAKWRAAVEELAGRGFIEDRGYRGEVFYVTHDGFAAADALGGGPNVPRGA